MGYSSSSPYTTSKLTPSACESKRETQSGRLAQGAHNRLGEAEEKLQSAMAEANRIVDMASERVQGTEEVKNLIGGSGKPQRLIPTHSDVQIKALEAYRDYLPFTPDSLVSIRMVDFHKLRKL